jgi:hypothetical protein
MYAVVRKWKADPARIDESVRKIQELFVPDVKSVEGFVAYYTVKGEGDEVFTITVCQDREGIEESTRRSKAFVDRELKGIIRGPPEVLRGEVRAEAAAGAPGKREQAQTRG